MNAIEKRLNIRSKQIVKTKNKKMDMRPFDFSDFEKLRLSHVWGVSTCDRNSTCVLDKSDGNRSGDDDTVCGEMSGDAADRLRDRVWDEEEEEEGGGGERGERGSDREKEEAENDYNFEKEEEETPIRQKIVKEKDNPISISVPGTISDSFSRPVSPPISPSVTTSFSPPFSPSFTTSIPNSDVRVRTDGCNMSVEKYNAVMRYSIKCLYI